MEDATEYPVERAFVQSLLAAVPELAVHQTEGPDTEDFIPNPAMYDVARGLVALARAVLAGIEPAPVDALERAFEHLDCGLDEPIEGPLPDLIHGAIGDWLSRQADDPPLMTLLLAKAGRRVQASIWRWHGDKPLGPHRRCPLPRKEVFREYSIPRQHTPRPRATRQRQQPNVHLPSNTPPIPADGPELLVKDSSEMYMLHRTRQRYTLTVTCGTVGQYDVVFDLTPDEIAAYRAQGPAFTLALARRAMAEPKAFAARAHEDA